MSFGLKDASTTYQHLVNHVFHKQLKKNIKVYIDDMLVKASNPISTLKT